MRVILYMATTINGFVAKENDDTGFVSETEWSNFRSKIQEIGNLVVGRRAYEIMRKNGDFKNLQNIKVVVVTKNSSTQLESTLHSVAKSPKSAVTLLAKQGFEKILVAGGGMLNGSFISEGLIDEIFIDIEPVAFGKGIKLFGENNFEAKLKLLGTKQLSPNEIQLHYEVQK